MFRLIFCYGYVKKILTRSMTIRTLNTSSIVDLLMRTE